DAADPRLAAILEFTRKLIEKPVEGDEAALKTLPAAGVSTPAVVTLSQLVAFLSYQVRLVAGLQAMLALEAKPAAAGTPPAPFPANTAATEPGAVIKAHGFTNEVLEWKAWLDVVQVDSATPEQIAVLEESHPKAKVSDYYLFLVHQPEILRQRSTAFNAIMYAPGGLSRAERELGATVVSRVNGCVYCASVHAQRFEQLAKRNDVIAQVFEDPATAGTTARELAIGKFSIQITDAPASVDAASIQALKDVGLSDGEVLDLLHSDAIFAWANRLMLNLGEPAVVQV
ncbi:peroxidase-related enzyme, partial [Achromobacter xylosoxidans]|uniref:peroxidase-related enzyme n=1 Tax=Alcaligenes xylosoxydans xylosoxydans TaxID=85698 RepID=UPI0009B6A9A1